MQIPMLKDSVRVTFGLFCLGKARLQSVYIEKFTIWLEAFWLKGVRAFKKYSITLMMV